MAATQIDRERWATYLETITNSLLGRQPPDNPLRSAVQAGRHGLGERGDLGDAHLVFSGA